MDGSWLGVGMIEAMKVQLQQTFEHLVLNFGDPGLQIVDLGREGGNALVKTGQLLLGGVDGILS